MTEERALVAAARTGDGQAFAQLLEAHFPQWLLLTRRLVGSGAEEVVQDAAVAIGHDMVDLDEGSSFSNWSYRVVTNAALSELRRRDEGHEASSLIFTDGRTADDDDDDSLEVRPNLDELLAQIPLDFRTVVILRDVLGLDFPAISEILDLPEATVRSRLARGRSHLIHTNIDLSGGGKGPAAVQEDNV